MAGRPLKPPFLASTATVAKQQQQTFPEHSAQVTSKPSEQNPDARAQDGGSVAGTLGQRLRRAREQRHISLREISDQTRISMRHLEAIEADNYKELPGGIFNRSFIRAYARQVGYDEKEALELYARTAREHGGDTDDPPTTATRSRVYMDGESTRSPLVTALLSFIILGVLILVVYAGLHWYRRTESAPADPAATNTSAPAGQTQAPAPQPTAQAPADGLQVQVKATGEVWLGTRVDEQAADLTLKDETREFKPQNRVQIRYSKSKLDAVEVTINGQVARAPAPNPKSGLVEWVITKDDYKQFLP